MSKKGKPTLFNLEVGTADLLRALNRVIPVVERRNTLPILSCVEIAVGFGTCALRTTDLDIELRAEIEARGDNAVCLPAQRLRDLLRAVSHVETVRLAADEQGVVTLVADEVSATMNSFAATDMPNLILGNEAWKAPLGEGVLGFLIGGVAHAISTEQTRYYLNGVCLEIREGALLAVATDGHRLAKREARLTKSLDNAAGTILPRKAAAIAVAACGKGEATISAHAGEAGNGIAHMEIVASGLRLRCKMIDGVFPDWRRVVPEPSNTVVEIDTKLLRRALRATAVNAERRMHRATKFSRSDGGIVVASRSPDDGEARAALNCPVVGDLPEFGLNGFYLDSIAAEMERIGSKTTRLHVSGSGAPLRIMPDAAISGTLNVLMPMRV